MCSFRLGLGAWSSGRHLPQAPRLPQEATGHTLRRALLPCLPSPPCFSCRDRHALGNHLQCLTPCTPRCPTGHKPCKLAPDGTPGSWAVWASSPNPELLLSSHGSSSWTVAHKSGRDGWKLNTFSPKKTVINSWHLYPFCFSSHIFCLSPAVTFVKSLNLFEP